MHRHTPSSRESMGSRLTESPTRIMPVKVAASV